MLIADAENVSLLVFSAGSQQGAEQKFCFGVFCNAMYCPNASVFPFKQCLCNQLQWLVLALLGLLFKRILLFYRSAWKETSTLVNLDVR